LLELLDLIKPLPFHYLTILAVLVLALPVFTFLVLLFLGHKIRHADWVATSMMFVSFVISFILFKNIWWGNPVHTRFDWINLNALLHSKEAIKFTLGIRIDKLAALMLMMVTFISFLVHLYSQDYMKGDRQYVRYFAYLNTFTASMLGIIVADNLFAIFIFWELVGLTSYLLIGFWYQKNAAIRASKKAFLMNRIGDLGFLIGLMVLWTQFGTLDLEALYQLMGHSVLQHGQWMVAYTCNGVYISHSLNAGWLTVAGIGIFCGCIGKSAQFPLQIWLPDAMEGPTPVSALIHAATMVAAGVFLLARVFVLLDIDTSVFITIIGCVSAFVGAYAAISQFDIKKILAYSTISQLGYMVMGMGAGAYNASLFHLLTHAFFKAGLFLCVGAVIHAMHHLQLQLEAKGTILPFDTQNVHLMGGLRKVMPKTFVLYLILSWAAMGLPFSSGFLSKDALLVGVWAWAEVMAQGGNWFYYMVPFTAFATAFITAFYMGRQLFIVFMGEFRLEKMYSEAKGSLHLIHDASLKMLIPLALLALLSIGFVFSLNPFDANDAWFMSEIKIPTYLTLHKTPTLQTQIAAAVSRHHVSGMVLSALVASLGLFLAYLRYGTTKLSTVKSIKVNPYGVAQQLSTNNFYIDQLYSKFGVKILLGLANRMAWIDKNVIDKSVNFIGVVHVALANIIAWFDLTIIDGTVGGVVSMAGKIGVLTRSFQSGKIQSYFIFVMSILLLFAVFTLLV
jgi:NADH-quinone oxidoreductase subunit L